MTSIQRPMGDLACALCQGAGYVVEPAGFHAEARVCRCVAPCDDCDDSGVRYIRGKDGVRVGRCRCRILPDRVELFNKAGIPARHATSSFVSFRPDMNDGTHGAWDLCRGWAERFQPDRDSRGLVLSGKAGRGKTHLLVAMLRHIIMEKGVEARFVEFSHLLSQLKSGFEDGRGESTTLTPLVRIPVLAIDELGKGRATEWEQTIADALVSHRYNAMATILATTNYPKASSQRLVEPNLARPEIQPALADRVGERVFSRLQSMCHFVTMRGEDYRTLGSM